MTADSCHRQLVSLSYIPVTQVPCSVCGAPSIRMTSWPDGLYTAACAEHADQPGQIGFWFKETP